MNGSPGYSRYSLLVTLHDDVRIPTSGYVDVWHVVSDMAYELQVWGRPLAPDAVIKITSELLSWSEDPDKPWTHQHCDAAITVRLTEKFIGWDLFGRPYDP
jgi:hypothetical protein